MRVLRFKNEAVFGDIEGVLRVIGEAVSVPTSFPTPQPTMNAEEVPTPQPPPHRMR
jgi:hypothetical protein